MKYKKNGFPTFTLDNVAYKYLDIKCLYCNYFQHKVFKYGTNVYILPSLLIFSLL